MSASNTNASGFSGGSVWRFFNPPITVEDPSTRFRLRALKTMAQATAFAVVVPLMVYFSGVAGKPSPLYLLLVSGFAAVMMFFALWMLHRRHHVASYLLVPAGFLMPHLVLPLGLTVELVYPVLIIMLFATVLLPTWANLSLNALHLAIVFGSIVFTDTYTLFPVGGNVNTTHYFSTYLSIYMVNLVYVGGFHHHLMSVRRDLLSRTTELGRINADLNNELATRMRELVSRDEELNTQRKSHAMAAVAGGIAHDINNLMAVIQGNSELLEAKLMHASFENADEIRTIMARVRRAIRRGEALTHRMLGVARQEPLETEPIDPPELAEAVIDLLRPTLPAHIRIVVDDEITDAVVEGDRAQLEQVLTNLLVNAVHAIGSRAGEVRVHMGETSAGQVMIKVQDTGRGIPTDLQAKVFEAFFTTKPDGVGTGLGLAQVKRVVEEHGGTVELRSREGHGTTMTLCFPRSEPTVRVSTPSQLDRESTEIVTRTGPAILLAEDEDDIADVIISALPAARIQRCRDAETAIRAIYKARAPYDVLLLDLTLPRGSGRSVFAAARKRWAHLPVIVTTGFVGSSDLQDMLAKPNTVYLRKPFSLRELRGAVARMTERSGPQPVAKPSGNLAGDSQP